MSDQQQKVKFVRTRLTRLHLVNFLSFEDYSVSFLDQDGVVKRMMGFHGPNGTGKSTILNAACMLFNNFTGYDQQRFQVATKKYVRNVENPDVAGESSIPDGAAGGPSFTPVGKSSKWMIEGEFVTEEGEEYVVRVSNDEEDYVWQRPDKANVTDKLSIKCPKFDHPASVKPTLGMQSYLASYDKELNQFQLRKDRWPIFKLLFETVTGYQVEKREVKLDEETVRGRGNERLALLDQYVLSISIKKPSETISERQCSDGEKKTIKNFTTVLNRDIIPSLILIDNVEMHVEIDRHVRLIRCIEECFPDSQILFTTHSPMIINEYDLGALVCLVNKHIPQGDAWRQRYARVVRGVMLMAQEESVSERGQSILSMIWDDRATDPVAIRPHVMELCEAAEALVRKKLD